MINFETRVHLAYSESYRDINFCYIIQKRSPCKGKKIISRNSGKSRNSITSRRLK